jgi:hypothetical protein
MNEKRVKKIKWLVAGLLILAFIVGGIYVLSSKIPPRQLIPLTNPETGIQNWIDAVNQRNIDRVYDLAPDEIKNQVTLVQFKEENVNNTILEPGFRFTNFTVINKQQNATYAQILAQVLLLKPANQGTLGTEIPIQYRFALYHEHGEWKIWTF